MNLKAILGEMMDFIIQERGEEVISERHQKNYKGEEKNGLATSQIPEKFTDLDFYDI